MDVHHPGETLNRVLREALGRSIRDLAFEDDLTVLHLERDLRRVELPRPFEGVADVLADALVRPAIALASHPVKGPGAVRGA